MTDDYAIEGSAGGYVPCFELPAVLVVEEEGAISGQAGGRVPRGTASGSLPAPEREAIVGSAVGFVAKPCEEVGCCIDAFGRSISATSVTNATSSGAFLGASDLGPDWDVLLVSDQDRVRVYVSEGPPPAWVTTISIATNGFEGHAQAKVNATAPNELGTTKSMRFRLQALPGTGDYAARVIFNPIGYSPTGPGGVFGGGVTLGSGLGGLGGAPYVSINPFAAGSSFVQNQSEIAFTASTWSIFEYYQIETPTPIPASFWVAGTTYTFEVLSEDLGGGSIRTTATVSSDAGSYSVSMTRPATTLPEYDAPTLTGPEIAILRSFSFADPDEWVIAVECVDIPELCEGCSTRDTFTRVVGSGLGTSEFIGTPAWVGSSGSVNGTHALLDTNSFWRVPLPMTPPVEILTKQTGIVSAGGGPSVYDFVGGIHIQRGLTPSFVGDHWTIWLIVRTGQTDLKLLALGRSGTTGSYQSSDALIYSGGDLANQTIWMRMRAESGGRVKGRAWIDGDPEPGVWQVECFAGDAFDATNLLIPYSAQGSPSQQWHLDSICIVTGVP